jgi:hypothetical protein
VCGSGGTGKTKQRTVTIPTGPFQQLKFEIIGPGDGVVTSTGAGVLGSLSVATTGTTRTSSLLIRTNEKFLPGSVANITVSGSLQRLQIPEINVTGNISISGGLRFINARSISGSTWSIGGTEALDARLGTVVNTSLSSTGDIANMTVASWTTDDGGTDALVARSIGVEMPPVQPAVPLPDFDASPQPEDGRAPLRGLRQAVFAAAAAACSPHALSLRCKARLKKLAAAASPTSMAAILQQQQQQRKPRM